MAHRSHRPHLGAARLRCFSIVRRRSNRHDLLFFAGKKLVDLGYGRVSHLLHLARLTSVFIFADLMVLLRFLEKIETIAAPSDGDSITR